LCDRLIERGHKVTALDNYQTGRAENLAHLISHPGFTMVEHDVVRPFDGAFDEIFNLACPASPPHYQSDAISTIRTCVIGTENLLALAVRNRARFFQASTSEVYGDPEVHPQPEEYRGNVNPIGIRACYDEGKRVAETLCFDYRRQHGVEIKVARIFNTYGPRMNPKDGRVVSNFVVQTL
jgi:UDP-glucuronate decarboxylase